MHGELYLESVVAFVVLKLSYLVWAARIVGPGQMQNKPIHGPPGSGPLANTSLPMGLSQEPAAAGRRTISLKTSVSG